MKNYSSSKLGDPVHTVIPIPVIPRYVAENGLSAESARDGYHPRNLRCLQLSSELHIQADYAAPKPNVPVVGTGAYKLHSYDDAGFWTVWEKRDDWDKSPTGILYGEPAPQYIVYILVPKSKHHP